MTETTDDRSMAEIKDGGPAFPRLSELTTHDAGASHTIWFSAESIGGMSLRDWFAGKALASGQADGDGPDAVADLCYLLADAMLKARERVTPQPAPEPTHAD